MNLWRRGARFTFQKHIPSDLGSKLGAAPIRIALPPCGSRDARRVAALLGGTAEATFHRLRLGMYDDDDPRDALIRELTEALAISEELRLVEVELVERRCLKERLDEQADMRERLARLGPPLAEIKDLLKKLKGKARPADIGATLVTMQEQIAALARGTPGLALPLFSEELPRYIAAKRKALPDSKFSRYTVPAAGAAFLEIVGDRPLMDYRPKDLEEFAWVLARAPANRAKLQRFARLSYREAGDLNADLNAPYPTLSVTTIRRQYLTPVKDAFAWLCNDHRTVSPLASARLVVPRTARPAGDRHPLSIPQQAVLLAEAARRVRPDDRWFL